MPRDCGNDPGALRIASAPTCSRGPPPTGPRLRRERVGFFQSFNLIPTLTAIENIVLPERLAKTEVDTSWLDSRHVTARPPTPRRSTGATRTSRTRRSLAGTEASMRTTARPPSKVAT